MLRHHALFLILPLLVTSLSCSGEDPVDTVPDSASDAATPQDEPEAEAPTPSPETSPAEPEGEEKEAVEEEAEPPPVEGASEATVLEGEPHIEEAVRGQPGLTDSFTAWGWSADGRLFAYETWMPGEGAVSCDMRYEIFVVDAAEDAFVDEGTLVVAHESPDGDGAGGCQPVDLEAAAEPLRSALLEKHGIVVGNLQALQPASAGSGRKFTLPGPGDSSHPLVFRVLHGSLEEPMSEAASAGAAYYMALKTKEGTSLILEPGKTRRPWILSYAPRGIFYSPDAKHAIVLIQRTHTAFEGVRGSWMVNGMAWPEYL